MISSWLQQHYEFVVATIIGIVGVILTWRQLTQKNPAPPSDKMVKQTAPGHNLIGQIGMARDIHIHAAPLPDIQSNATASQRIEPVSDKPVNQPKSDEWPRLESITDIRVYNAEEMKNRLETAPHIDLIFSLPQSSKPTSVVRPEAIKVVNTKISIAYNVQIQPIESEKYRATFAIIPRLEKGENVYAEMDLSVKPARAYFKYFEKLLHLESDQPSEDREFKIAVPLVVRFRDSKGDILYETRHEAVYNILTRSAYIRLVEGTIIVRES